MSKPKRESLYFFDQSGNINQPELLFIQDYNQSDPGGNFMINDSNIFQKNKKECPTADNDYMLAVQNTIEPKVQQEREINNMTSQTQNMDPYLLIQETSLRQNRNFSKFLLNKFFKFLEENQQYMEPQEAQRINAYRQQLRTKKFKTTDLQDIQRIFCSEKTGKMNRRLLNRLLESRDFYLKAFNTNYIKGYQGMKGYYLALKIAKLRCKSEALMKRMQFSSKLLKTQNKQDKNKQIK